MKTFNRLNINWFFVGACIVSAIVWHYIFRFVHVLYLHLNF